ncbi:MAG: hypothetical protein D6828_05320, partial [Nitrospirae bacterium]
MRKYLFILLILLNTSIASGGIKVYAPDKVDQGSAFSVVVRCGEDVKGSYDGKILHFIKIGDVYRAIGGVDLDAPPNKKYHITITCGDETIHRTYRVVRRRFGLQRLTLPKEKVELTPEILKRVKLEAEKFKRLWSIETPFKIDGAFIMPVRGSISSSFGLRRIINGKRKSPHSGIDIRAKEGTPI